MIQKVKMAANFSMQWREDGIVLAMREGDTVFSTWLNPLEVEAMIIHLCQSPWREAASPVHGVTIH